MSEFSKIEWTTHTFNPWWGCVRVSPACRFCYADTQASRYGHDIWRRKGPRRMASRPRCSARPWPTCSRTTPTWPNRASGCGRSSRRPLGCGGSC
jgi:hypothetical protein